MSAFIENELSYELPETWQGIVSDVVQGAADFVHCPYPCQVNVLFTDNAGICEINREQREIDAPTDVLSFPMLEFDEPEDFSVVDEEQPWLFDQETNELILGDIVLNIDRIRSQAEEYGHSERRELAFLTAHSMLHLFGHDHMEDAERVVMEEKQEKILQTLGYTRDQ